jgi:hypothetical protein
MLGVILGWYVRSLYERRLQRRQEPPPEPFAVFEGLVTMNQLTASSPRGEYEFGPFDEQLGYAPLIKEGERLKQVPTRVTTFIDDEDNGQQLTIRWEKSRGKLVIAKARSGELWRIEFYRMDDVGPEMVTPTITGRPSDGFQPYGGQPGGGLP